MLASAHGLDDGGRGGGGGLRASRFDEAALRHSDGSVAPRSGGGGSFGSLIIGKPGSFHRGRMEVMVRPILAHLHVGVTFTQAAVIELGVDGVGGAPVGPGAPQ